MQLWKIIILIMISLVCTGSLLAQNYPPTVSNVQAHQRPSSRLVEVTFDLQDLDQDTLCVTLQVSEDSGKTFTVPAWSFAGDCGCGILPGPEKTIVWDAGNDYPEHYGTKFQVKVIASDSPIRQMTYIPADTFYMGSESGLTDQQPVHTVSLSGYYINRTEVSNAEYKFFCDATRRSYPTDPVPGYFLNYPDYPVVNVSWYDAVEYCNWLSQREGLQVCYDTGTWSCDFSKNGYRLPTEAEWERAARGGLDRKIYPWGDSEPSNNCNYRPYSGLLTEYMPNFSNGRGPLSVGSFAPTGFRLYDITGNVWEWCHDWYGETYYSQSPRNNPTGPTSGDTKVFRGGSWNSATSFYLWCSYRDKALPGSKRNDLGFRYVRR